MKVTEMETVQSPSVEKKPVDQNNILALSDETNLKLYELDEVSPTSTLQASYASTRKR